MTQELPPIEELFNMMIKQIYIDNLTLMDSEGEVVGQWTTVTDQEGVKMQEGTHSDYLQGKLDCQAGLPHPESGVSVEYTKGYGDQYAREQALSASTEEHTEA